LVVTDKQLLEGLAQLGWMEGRNLRVDYRLVGSNDPDLILPHAEGMVRSAPDIIYAIPGTTVRVLQRLTSSIPIVFLQNGDPVRDGAVQSLAHPGGNMTGFLGIEPSINTKYLQLLNDMAPQVKRVAVIQTEATQTARAGSDFAAVAVVAQSLSITHVALLVRDDASDIERAIVGFAQEPNGGLIMPPDIGVTRHRAGQSSLRWQSNCVCRPFRTIGSSSMPAASCTTGLRRSITRRVAAYVDRILRGANPGELPVVTPDKFNLVINLKTATALGLTIPPSLFALADEVVE
jgi:putative tryptophan/tyrosine transport system substrate-binding protein